MSGAQLRLVPQSSMGAVSARWCCKGLRQSNWWKAAADDYQQTIHQQMGESCFQRITCVRGESAGDFVGFSMLAIISLTALSSPESKEREISAMQQGSGGLCRQALPAEGACNAVEGIAGRGIQQGRDRGLRSTGIHHLMQRRPTPPARGSCPARQHRQNTRSTQ